MINSLAEDKIDLSKEQQQAVDYTGEQMLVRGIAGSGKTLVLLKKARKVATENPEENVAIFSYGKPLSEAAEKLIKDSNLPNLKVFTFHSWAYRAYRETFNRNPWYTRKEREKFKTALETVKVSYPNHRFFKNKDLHEFLKEEVSWIKGVAIEDYDSYLSANRRGRGGKVRLSQEDRKVLYKVYEAYEKEKGNTIDYDDAGLVLYNAIDKIPDSVKFDHVFIDEAQDLTKVSLKVLIHCARKTCTVGADMGQKIYTTSFTWRDVGLHISGGRTRILRSSYRSTKQIVQLANSIQKNDEISNDEEFTEPTLPTVSGPTPTIFITLNKDTHDEAIMKAAKQLVASNERATVGILCRNWETINRLNRKFDQKGIKYTEIGNNPRKWGDRACPGTHLEPGIKFTTFHTAKGLEFHYVIVADLINPDLHERLGDEFDWDLERRLLYVAMTRAMAHLQMYTYEEDAKLLKELDTSLYERVNLLDK